MNILEEIIGKKKNEVIDHKKSVTIKQLEKSDYFQKPVLSLRESLWQKDSLGIIAEFKRKSPSKGIINATATVPQTTTGYVLAGASALSVLTDFDFFGGSNDDLRVARGNNLVPILRKDFTIDEYQIVEAKSIGADAVLLIVAALTPEELKALHEFAQSLSLEVLVEVHNKEELLIATDIGARLIGVNNRNLKTFEVNVGLSKELSALMPDHVVKISESGISSVKTIQELHEYGYKGFLMGENFMKHHHPEIAAKNFMDELRNNLYGK